MGEDVGQNLQSKSRSKNSESLSCEKEGHFLKFPLMSICVSAASSTYCRVIIHFQGLFSRQGKGNTRCLIHFCGLSLFLSALSPSNSIPSAVSLSCYVLQLSAACGVFYHEPVPLGVCDISLGESCGCNETKWMENAGAMWKCWTQISPSPFVFLNVTFMNVIANTYSLMLRYSNA